MIKKNNFPTLYIASVCMVLFLSTALLLMNNFSKQPITIMIEDTLLDSEQVTHIFTETEEAFSSYEKMINAVANTKFDGAGDWVSFFDKQTNILMDGFSLIHPYISGQFVYVLNEDGLPVLQKYKNYELPDESGTDSSLADADGKVTHISVLMDNGYINDINNTLKSENKPIFKSITNHFTGSFLLSHIVPLYVDGEYRGFFGIIFDNASIDKMLAEANTESNGLTLLSKELEVISSTENFNTGERLETALDGAFIPFAPAIKDEIKQTTFRIRNNGRILTYVSVNMPTGQFFLESFDKAKMMTLSNFLIILLAFYALLCINLVQKKDDKSLFDYLSLKIIGSMDELQDEKKISSRASFAMRLSLMFASFALFMFNLLTNDGLLRKAAFGLLFLTCLLVLFYKPKETGPKIRYFYIVGYLMVPILMHSISGGFASANSGQVIIFCIFAVILSCYILNRNKSTGIFSIFVALLFLEAILEILYMPNINAVYVIRWVTVIFFLGFGVYLITELYVTEVHNLLNKLKDTQSILVKKEKMVTLGTLMAGIAHEINTPLGAIKVSSEGIVSSLQTIFDSLVASGRNLSDVDISRLRRLHLIVYDSLNEMYTTSEIRKSKPVLHEFFTNAGCANVDKLVDKLARLEFCNIEVIKANEDVFLSDNIGELLDIVIKTLSLTKGSYIIKQSTARASKIVFALKSYSHSAISSDPVWFSIVQNVDNVLVLMYNQMKGHIELVKNYDENLPEIIGNPDELGQVWINLIQNAIYAIGISGTLTVSIINKGDNIQVDITDTGEGIKPEVMGQIFEPFYTTKPPGEGTGLGLDICKKIIENHNGYITAESVFGEGTTFSVTIPYKS